MTTQKIEDRQKAVDEANRALQTIIEHEQFMICVGVKEKDGITVRRVSWNFRFTDVPSFMEQMLRGIMDELTGGSVKIEDLPEADLDEFSEFVEEQDSLNKLEFSE